MLRNAIGKSVVTLATTVACALLMQTPALADTTLVDQTLPGPVGGAQVCVVGVCAAPVNGITNVRISAVVQGGAILPPALTTGTAPGCTANANVGLFLTTPGIGGVVHTSVSFDRTDMNGNVISGSHETIQKDVPVGLGSQAVPLASVCATIL